MGIEGMGRMGFVSSTSRAFDMYSLAASTSPRDSRTSPKLYLKIETFDESINSLDREILAMFGGSTGRAFPRP